MRPIWTGNIIFSLINIPVHLYTGSKEHPLTFDLLHKSDLSPIRYARVCLADGKEIPYQDIVKGYEYQKGEYVVLEEEDFKSIEKQKGKTIQVLQFVDASEVDTIFFEKPYYLEPGKGADPTYALFLETLKRSKKRAIVKYVFRNKEHLGMLAPYQNMILLMQMRFASEISSTAELKLPDETVNKKDLEMAVQLVNQLTSQFQPEKFKDDYTEELQQTIEAKIKGIKPSKKAPAAPKSSKIHDISALLKESLKKTGGAKKPATKVIRKKRA